MKIAYLLGSLNRGGTETLLLDVFRNAKQNKLNAIGIYRKTGVLEPDFMQCGIQMQKISYKNNVFSYFLRLRKFLIENKIDVVHAQQSIDALYGFLACLGTNKRIILTFHGYDFTEKFIGKRILRFIIKQTDLNFYVSDTQRMYYQKKYNLNRNLQKVVYNGISFDKLDLDVQNEATKTNVNLCEELHLDKNSLLIGAVGNFNEVRDQLTICKFLKLLYDANIDFYFVFAGKRIEDKAYLYDNCVDFCQNNGLSENVSFLGIRDDIPQILKQLDAFVYSTNHDTFGIAVMEAIAVGIPVFVNDWGVMNEITYQGKLATLYKTKDEKDLLQKFMLFLQDKPVYLEKALEAATFVRQQYCIEKHILALKQEYERL